MATVKQVENTFTDIELSPTHRKKISELLNDRPDRFRDSREFIERAIDVFLTWEIDPKNAQTKMMEMEPTMRQFAFMQSMMKTAEIKMMYPGYPEKFGKAWDEFEAANKEMLTKTPSQETNTEQSKRQMDARQSERDFEKMQEEIQASYDFIKQIKFDEISDEMYDEVTFDEWPLLFTHYSRLLPAKIGVLTLAYMMKELSSPLVDLDDFKIKAYDIAEEISKKLFIFEQDEDITREHRKSTGLPRPYHQTGKMNPFQGLREKRYKDRVFGKIVRNRITGDVSFEGLLMALGLIRVFARNKKAKITLSEIGKKFCLFENPMFNDSLTTSLSKDECGFLATKCIPKRPLELKIIQNVINIIKETDHGKTQVTPCELDEVCTTAILEYVKSKDGKWENKIKSEIIDRTERLDANNKSMIARKGVSTSDEDRRELDREIRQTPIEACRIATMGRISELGIVKWSIEGGRSEYTIADEKLAESITKL